MARFFLFLYSLLLFNLGTAQQTAPRIRVSLDGPAFPWNNLEVNNTEGTFRFAIVSDRTGGHRPGVFEDAIHKLNLLQPEFVMSVGDFIEGYTTDTAELERQWKEFNGFIDELEVPFFYVPGNHDITNPVMDSVWRAKFGATYYSFLYQDVLFLCLNSEDQARGAGKGSISQPQYEWIEKELAAHADARWTLVFMHQPLWNQDNPEMWPEVEKLLEPRKHTVFVGHNHRYVRYERNQGRYYVLASTGGGSRLRGPRYGEFDHVMWATMTEEGPILANLLLEGIWDEAVVTDEYAAMFRGLSQQNPLMIEPVLVEGDTYTQGKTTLRIRNDSDFPMAVSLVPGSDARLWVVLNPITDTLAPNTTRVIEVPITAQQAVPLTELQPLSLEAGFTYLGEDQPEFRVDAQYHFRPEKRHEMLKARKNTQADALLKDWEPLRFGSQQQVFVNADPFSHKGAADGAFEFDFSADAQFVYVAVSVTDDEWQVKDSESPYNQDAVAILLDGRPLRIAANARTDEYRESLVLLASPAESGSGPANLFRSELIPAGVSVSSLRTDTGYVIEAAIPHAILDALQGTSWQTVRVNVGIRDLDQQGMHQSSLLWQPDWRGKENRVGSGIFYRP